MFLQELKRLAEAPRLASDLTPEGYKSKPVRHVIMLDRNGRWLATLDRAGAGPRDRRGQAMVVPDVVRSSGTRPLLLADGPDYVFGLDSDPARAGRARARQAAFLDQVKDCASRTGRAEVAVVRDYLATGSIPDDLDPDADIVTFDVDGTLVTDLPEVRAYWAAQLRDRSSPDLECLVCGQTAPAAQVWPILIRGIPGGQSAGNQLASANEDAFESYGLKGSLTSPACLDCAAQAGKALNWLLDHEAHSLRTPSSVFVFWTREEVGFNSVTFLLNPEPQMVAALLKSSWTGRSTTTDIDEEAFFAAEIGTSGSRVALRTWIESTVPEARANLKRYFQRQWIVQADGSAPRPLSIRALAAATARDLNSVAPHVTAELVKVALAGTRLPDRLLVSVIRRCRVERRVTTPQAALLKLALLAGDSFEEAHMTALDPTCTDRAYLCGRLLAELEAAQWAALGVSTIGDRFFGAASSSPATVFGPLIRGSQHHLSRLRRDKRAVYVAIDSRITDILDVLRGSFPQLLTVREQAQFGLGYYHQKASNRADARAHMELADTVEQPEK